MYIYIYMHMYLYIYIYMYMYIYIYTCVCVCVNVCVPAPWLSARFLPWSRSASLPELKPATVMQALVFVHWVDPRGEANRRT